MIRGSTVTHVFNIPFEANKIKELKITYSQNDSIVLFRKRNNCTVDDYKITVTLLQEDTFKFDSSRSVNIQLRILTNEGIALSSKVFTVSIGKCLDNEVLV